MMRRIAAWWSGLSRRAKIIVAVVATFLLLAAIGAAVGTPAEPIAGASPTAQQTASQTPTTPTPNPTPTIVPTASPTVDPELAYQVWLTVFPDQFDSLKDQLANGIESDFFWISSVDRLTYTPDTNTILVEATIEFESLYLNDPNEWHSDTWDLYQSWSRDMWASFIDGWESGNTTGVVADWPRWTPTFTLKGNAGHLTATCPGDLIYRVSQRDATQTEFLAECSFKP